MEINFSSFDKFKKLSEQRDLFRLSFPEAIGTSTEGEEHYNWKFHSFPSERKSYEYIAENDGELVGYYAAIPYRYKIQGEINTCAMVCDVMTHPKMRGRGVFTKIGNYSTKEMKNEGLMFTTGYPVRPEVIPGHLKVGWEVAFDLPMFLCPVRANDILKIKRLGLLSPFVNLCLTVFHALINLTSSRSLKDVELVDKALVNEIDDQKLLELIKKWERQIDHPLVKDSDFLRWRFGAPDVDYRLVGIKYKGNYTAVAFARVTNLQGVDSLAILDLMIDEEYFSHKDILFKFLKKVAIIHDATVVAGITSKYWYKKYQLLKNGYLKSPVVFKFICKILNFDDNGTFLDEKKWHLMWIDSDDL